MAPAEDRILASGFRAAVIEVLVQTFRNRQVGFLDPSSHLLIQPLLQVFGVPHDRGGIAILGFEVRQHRWITAVSKPEVIILPELAMNQLDSTNDLGDGRGERCFWGAKRFLGFSLGGTGSCCGGSGESCYGTAGIGRHLNFRSPAPWWSSGRHEMDPRVGPGVNYGSRAGQV